MIASFDYAETNQVTGARSWQGVQMLHIWNLAPPLETRCGEKRTKTLLVYPAKKGGMF